MTGAFCISIDVERGWAIWDRPDDEYFARCRSIEPDIIVQLLGLFERHQVSATWAIVGSLLDEDASPDDRLDLWTAHEDVEKIRAASPRQEIGSHGYRHAYFDELSKEEVRADLRRARQIHDAHQLPFTSFVFPRNQIGYLGVLQEFGVSVYRSTDQTISAYLSSRFGRSVGRAAHFVEQSTGATPPLVAPIQHAAGLVELPSSMLLMGRNSVRRMIPAAMTLRKACVALERAAREGGLFHLWFHPSNFYYDTAKQLHLLDMILRRAAWLRDYHGLQILTMDSYSAEVVS